MSLNRRKYLTGMLALGLGLSLASAAHAITVKDEGRGFDPEAEEDAVPSEETQFDDDRDVNDPISRNAYGQYGLLGMRERAAIIGAELNIISEIGKGTCIHLRMPFRPNVLAPEKAAKK